MFKYNKIFLSITFYILSVFIYKYYSYNDYKQKEIETVNDKLKIGAYAVYNTLGEDFFKIAINKNSISLEEDLENIHKLSFYNNHANLAFIYSSIKINNEVYLTSSSASEEELKEKSELHYFHHYNDAGKALRESFESKKIVYENYTDKWGSFRAVHIPIMLENSQLIVISAEISMESYLKILNDIKSKYFWETLIYLLLTLPIMIAFYFSIKEKNLQNLKIQQELLSSEKLASMGEILGNISHQWRQPLSVISTQATGLKLSLEHELNPSQDEILKGMDNINNQAQYLSRTIDDFRSFFKGNTYDIKEFDIKDLFDIVENLTKDSFRASYIDYHQKIMSCNIEANQNILIQVLTNIYNNTKDVMEERNIKSENRMVFVKCIKKDNELIITIKDTGGGIEEDIFKKIFEPYFTTKHQSIGTGMGLYISNQIIVKQLNGTIDVSNESFTYNETKYKGAKFTINIPV